MAKETIIIGGGLAGLAAAATLAERGVPVTLLESRPRLGGRASSFLDRTTGSQIDNCQHVSMGCCTNFQKFCETIGLSGHFRRETTLYFVGPEGRVNSLAAGLLPAPFHLWGSFRRLSYLCRKDKACLARGLRALACARSNSPAHARRADRRHAERDGTFDADADQSFARWLRDHDQTPAAINRFWHVVLVSALSESLDRIDVASARQVFVDAFLANRRGWEVQIPNAPLDTLYGTTLRSWLQRRGVSIRLQAGVSRIVVEDDRAAAVELRDGRRLAAEELIAAVPHHLLGSLLPEQLAAHQQIAGLSNLQSAPISSVHLWFDRPITGLPHAVFVERLSQWMFNRTLLQQSGAAQERQGRQSAGLPGPQPSTRDSQPYYYQVVISASRDLKGVSQDAVIDAVVVELSEVWPNAREARLLHGRLVTEHRAVFSVMPGADRWRPSQQSPVANLQFAGDWTRTGWPPTMEGAVRSGFLAAENILRRLGRPENVLAPDLPVAPLSKLLLGL